MRVTALCGGIGGAKLALGLEHSRATITLVVNTGDDFDHYGLPICPDLDTVLYTLSGRANAEQGWGREDESFGVQDELLRLGQDGWFTLGDKDIALHLVRADLLGQGLTLTQVIGKLQVSFEISANILPMSDQASPTTIESSEGVLSFQDYFVKRRCAPEVRAINCGGSPASPDVMKNMHADNADAIILCPSNPLLSVLPILETNGIRDSLRLRKVPALAVSPIVGGQAVKGPTAKIFGELGLDVNGYSVAKIYQGLIDVFILDETERELAPEIEALGIRVEVADTMMRCLDDKIKVAEFCLQALSRS